MVAVKIHPNTFSNYVNIPLPVSVAARPCTSRGLVQIIPRVYNQPIHSMYPCGSDMHCLVHPREPLQCHGLSCRETSTLIPYVAFNCEKCSIDSLLDDKSIPYRYGDMDGKQKLSIWFDWRSKYLRYGKWTLYRGLASAMSLYPNLIYLSECATSFILGMAFSWLRLKSMACKQIHESK